MVLMFLAPCFQLAAVGPRSLAPGASFVDDALLQSAMGGRRVLVIEDDADLRETLISILDDEGIEAVGAENGASAFALLDAGERPDLILLDLGMPVMDGWTFAARLREMADVGATPIAVMSAGRNLARAPVSAAYLEKPVRREELLDVVARLSRP
jgi:two-component system chemotaxis response regulator CheY